MNRMLVEFDFATFRKKNKKKIKFNKKNEGNYFNCYALTINCYSSISSSS